MHDARVSPVPRHSVRCTGTRERNVQTMATEYAWPRIAPENVEYPNLSTPSPLLFVEGGVLVAHLCERRLDLQAEVRVALHLFLDLPDGMDDGRVVTPAEELSDPRQRHPERFLHQVHGHLAWNRDVLRSPLGRQRVRTHSPATSDELANTFGGEDRAAVGPAPTENAA